MGNRRDDFTAATKELLAKRVGYRCSNPFCRKPTIGPSSDENKTVNIGVAAHIRAAAPGGKRYDPYMSSEARKAAYNGIWMCQSCSKLIDSDEEKYTIHLLHRWKQEAEEIAIQEMERNFPAPTAVEDVELIKFYVQCMDRPAFQDPLRLQMRKHDPLLLEFEQAVIDTTIALNTGVLRTRTGEIIKKAEGKSQLRNPQWNQKLCEIVDILTGIYRSLQSVRDPENLSWYDGRLECWMERERMKALEIINSICTEIGMNTFSVRRI